MHEVASAQQLSNARPIYVPDGLPSSYSLASLYSLTDYERLLYLQGPGVLLDASALDSLLAFSKSAPMAAYPETAERQQLSTALMMVHPTKDVYRQLRELRASQPLSDVSLLRKAFAGPESLFSEWSLSMGDVVYESRNLRSAGEGFNATAFETTTTLVRFSDPEMPGPQFDVPYLRRMELRPDNEEAGTLWEGLYEQFRQRRIEVCGLDLDLWTEPTPLAGGGGGAGDAEVIADDAQAPAAAGNTQEQQTVVDAQQ